MLRPIRDDDRTQIWQWRNQPDVAKFMYNREPIVWETHCNWFEQISGNTNCVYWIISVNGTDVGVACLTDIMKDHQTASWAFYIADTKSRGVGVGAVVEFTVCRYGFEKLGLRRIWCEVLEWNQSIIRMHEKFGFVREGHKRQHIHSSEGVCDVIQLGMLDSEWHNTKAANLNRLTRVGFALRDDM